MQVGGKSKLSCRRTTRLHMSTGVDYSAGNRLPVSIFHGGSLAMMRDVFSSVAIWMHAFCSTAFSLEWKNRKVKEAVMGNVCSLLVEREAYIH